MRKYFLLSAVALMAATNVMAENYGGTVEVNAKIEKVTKMDCTPLNFGTIYLTNNNAESRVYLDSENGTTFDGDVVRVVDATHATCTNLTNYVYDEEGDTDVNVTTLILPDRIYLTGAISEDVGDPAYVTDINTGFNDVYGTLVIPALMNAGTLTGSFTITAINP
ncbi:MAG: hypothetical protein E7016_05635 [Alphaproteobacteria bacterium]|nr:hypothetical protein [Alphaproteobacteria bacterium]